MHDELDGSVKCWNCGKRATQSLFDRKAGLDSRKKIEGKQTWYRCFCDECFKEFQNRAACEREQYIYLKKREMFRKACNIIENQNINMYRYKDAIDAVEEVIEEHPDKFDSSYEVVAAIILVYNHIYAKMQYKIGDYQVDFYLPEEQVVLEIDGERHKQRRNYDSLRDEYIRRTLGRPWEIVRIPTSLLDKNAKMIPEAIERVLDYRSVGKVNWRELYDN